MTDAKTIALTWLLRFAEKQGIAVLLAIAISLFFGWKMHRLEQRLDDCQSAREDQRIERVVESSEAVIRAIETLIGRLDQAPAPTSSRIKTTRIQ